MECNVSEHEVLCVCVVLTEGTGNLIKQLKLLLFKYSRKITPVTIVKYLFCFAYSCIYSTLAMAVYLKLGPK